MRKIIFIGGTGRSGSTLLDLILANDPKAMSLGEIYALFRPTRKHHFDVLEKLKKDPLWSTILKDGKRQLYPNLIKYFPEINIFVDSSKDPFWFKYHEKVLNADYDVRHVLIFKTPHELAQSYIKRGKKKSWIRTYIHYHKQYFALIDNFISISYKNLVKDDAALEKLCEMLGINYFATKKHYWEREHNTFFGSNSVKEKHSYDATKQLSTRKRQDITYDYRENYEVKEYIDQLLNENPKLIQIFEILKQFDLSETNKTIRTKDLGYNKIFLGFIMLKQYLKNKYKFYYPEDYFNTNKNA